MVAAEIGLDHAFVLDHILRLALRDDMALVEHDHARGERHDHLHDVLDDHERDAHAVDATQQLDRALDLAGCQPRQRLVEQHQPRLQRQHARNLQPLAAGRAEPARPLIGEVRKPGDLQHLERTLACVGAMRMAQIGADHDILQHRHVLERRRHLEGAADAGARMDVGRRPRQVDAVEAHGAAGRHGVTRETIEEGRFPRRRSARSGR